MTCRGMRGPLHALPRPIILPKEELCAPCFCKYKVHDRLEGFHFDHEMCVNFWICILS